MGSAIADLNLDAVVDHGNLVVSEFVANTVEHTGCRRIRVTTTRIGDDRVRVKSSTGP